jgi:hypothetical protein
MKEGRAIKERKDQRREQMKAGAGGKEGSKAKRKTKEGRTKGVK